MAFDASVVSETHDLCVIYLDLLEAKLDDYASGSLLEPYQASFCRRIMILILLLS
jgi:hypothetical protein